MDLQTGLICVGVVVISAVVILLVSMFGMKEKSYEEAIAEQRKLPDDLLISKKEKGKDKKHKNKAGKKVKEKKDEKEEKDDKPEHIQFEETPQILPAESPVRESTKGSKKKGKADKVKPILINKDESPIIGNESVCDPSVTVESNHFDLIQPKDDLELIRSQSKENLQQAGQFDSSAGNKSPKETPTKTKKAGKESTKKKDENLKEEKKEAMVNMNSTPNNHKETSAKEIKDSVKEVQSSRRSKKKNDILAQIGGDKDGVDVTFIKVLIQNTELSRSEIQILIDQLLNKQLDNPSEHSEWTEGRADPVIKLKKQLAEKEKALTDEREASTAVQGKLKELRAEFNSERSRLSSMARQLEEALNGKITETRTLHTRMQHILESHAAEKQGFARQIEQLQSKVKDDAAIIHKMQEDQGQTQGHLQQELIAQCQQLEVQFAQMRDNENVLKAQLTQKHVEVQELQNELQVTCENSTAEVELLRQRLGMMQEELMHTKEQHIQETEDRFQDMTRQLEESHRLCAELDHTLKNTRRHDQELQKQLNSLKTELKSEVNENSALKSELMKLKSELTEMNALRNTLKNKDNDLKNYTDEIDKVYKKVQEFESKYDGANKDLKQALDDLTHVREESTKYRMEAERLGEELTLINGNLAELKSLNLETNKSQDREQIIEMSLQVTRLQEENNRLSDKLQHIPIIERNTKMLEEQNKFLTAKLDTITQEKLQKDKTEQSNLLLLTQRETQMDALKTELTHKEDELNKLNAQVDTLKINLDQQKSKNNELRVKNWKVMEALNNAELHIKSNDSSEKGKSEQEELTKAFLQRIFPKIKVSERSYDKWISAFEKKACDALVELNNKNTNSESESLKKQNDKLQLMVTRYENIVQDTQSMLTKLESKVELEETRWQAQLHQKENEITNLRIEIDDLRKKFNKIDKPEPKMSDTRVESMNAQSARGNDTSYKALGSKSNNDFIASEKLHTAKVDAIEKLEEEKQRLSEALLNESSKRASLDAEVTKLRSIVEKSESNLIEEKNLVTQFNQEMTQLKNEEHDGSCSISEQQQSTMNGPPVSDSSKSERSLTAPSLIAALENTILKNTDIENHSITNPIGLVQSEQEIHTGSVTTKLSSTKSCGMTNHTDQASWNPLIGQQQKKHKKKRKGGSGKK